MITILTTILFDSDSRFALLALGPAAGVGFYAKVFFYYRNTNKSYQFETTTSVTTSDWKKKDRKVDHISRTRESKMRGRNENTHRTRVKRY